MDNDDITDDDFTDLLWDHLRGIAGLQEFPLGKVVITPGAKDLLDKQQIHVIEFLDRHGRGDWGTVGKDDWALNDQALIDGTRILSAYTLDDDSVIWVITEADRSSTTILLPSEY